MKFTHSALTVLLSSATAHKIFRGARPIFNKDLIPRQSSSPSTTPSFPTFSIPSGTSFGGTAPTGTATHHSHGTGRPSATHHSAGGRQTKSRRFPRQFPSITASSFSSSPTTNSSSPINGTATAFPSGTSFPTGGFPTGGFPTGGFPTGGFPTGSRRPHPTQTGPFPTFSFPFPSGSGTGAPFSFPTAGPSFSASGTGFGFPSAAPSSFRTSVLNVGG